MAYFSDDITQMRLHILYLIKKFNDTLTNPQLTVALLENANISYLDIQLCISELEQIGYIAAVPCAYGTGYNLTSKGDELLDLFESSLPQSVRKNCDDYIAKNKQRLLRSEQITSNAMRKSSGGYDAVLSSFEKERLLFSLSINMPDAEMAKRVCDVWEERADEIYSAILKLLLGDKG